MAPARTEKTMNKPVAKSLHTVTVIIQIAKLARGVLEFGDNLNERCVDRAMKELGLADRPDPYGLRAKALKLMTA
jgi:hypothetical protein